MASLSCLSIFEAGAFGSNSGNVIIPTSEVPFPIDALGVGTATGTGTALGLSVEGATVGTASAIGSALGSAAATRAALGTAAGVGAAAAVAAPNIRGAQVRKSVDQTTANYSSATAVAWAQADFDTDGFFSGGSPTKLIVPSSLNGYYVVVSAMISAAAVAADNPFRVYLQKNGADFDGCSGARVNGGAGANGTATLNWLQTSSHVIQVATGDEFEVYLHSVDSSITVTAAESCLSIRVIGSSVQGALVKNTADLTAQNFSTTPVLTWNSEVYDTDTFHDTGSNTSRLTVPVAYNGRYAIIRASWRLTSVSNSQHMLLSMQKNGASFPEVAYQAAQNGVATDGWMYLESHPVQVATSDIFTVFGFCADTSTTMEAEGSFFSIEILPVSFSGVLAKLTSNLTANYTTPTAIAFAGADRYDTDAAHDPSSNNTKIIVPAAWNGRYGQLTFSVNGTSDLTNNQTVSIGILKGAVSGYNGFGAHAGHNGTFTKPIKQTNSQIVQLSTGDEYTAVYWNSADTSVTIATGDGTAFGLRVFPVP